MLNIVLSGIATFPQPETGLLRVGTVCHVCSQLDDSQHPAENHGTTDAPAVNEVAHLRQ